MLKSFVVEQLKLRLDRFLAENMPEVSRSRIQRDIIAGKVTVNGAVILESKFVVRLNDRVEYALADALQVIPEHVDIKVLFENEDIVIVDKPAGLVVHPAPGYKGPTLVSGLIEKYKDIQLVGEDEVRPGIVHRLDKDTSGVMLVAKSQRMFEHLKNAFTERTVKKEYLALVCGRVLPRHNVIEAPIGRHPRDFRKMTTHLPKDPKPALTEYEVLEYLQSPAVKAKTGVDEFTLLKVKLHTGRTHQIRVHLAAQGFPIAGDVLYGKASTENLQRQFLHAAQIEVKLLDGTWIEAHSALPEDLQLVLETLIVKK